MSMKKVVFMFALIIILIAFAIMKIAMIGGKLL